MLLDLTSTGRQVFVTDITLVICLRAHEGNPWILDRLRALQNYYVPQPQVLIIDFGSVGQFRQELEEIARLTGYRLVHVPDYGTYSASAAHNAALPHVETDFIFFMDIDFIGVRSLFSDLARTATAASMVDIFDIILDLPAYHIEQAASERIETCTDLDLKSLSLDRLGFSSQRAKFGGEIEFIAPYSNIFLISKKYFDLCGGYHSAFKGHGSEDFEFFVRANTYSQTFEIPKDSKADCYGPSKKDFFFHKYYRGFRSLNQLIAARTERAGLKIFHLWHPKDEQSNWRKKNDWKRGRLSNVLDSYLCRQSQLALIDAHVRPKKAICICKHEDHWGYFVPLRLHGYTLIPFYDDTDSTIEEINELIDKQEIDAFAIFNPYMKSHERFYDVFVRARDMGISSIVVERGALPNTIYYADDVSYTSKSFSAAQLNGIALSDQERVAVRRYIEALQSGEYLLEGAATRQETQIKYSALGKEAKRKILIPLQLEDDMAVTKFTRQSQSYRDFLGSLSSTIAGFDDAIFVVKPHPLSKISPEYISENIIEADRLDNIHELIDICDAVVCYNSGVGLLASCHGRPIVTVGNAFYNLPGIGHFADSLEDAIKLALGDISKPRPDKIENLVGQYLFYRYSWFDADDEIKEFKVRKAHGYKNIRVSRSCLNNTSIEHRWEKSVYPGGNRNYIFAVANLGTANDAGDHSTAEKLKSLWLFNLYSLLYGLVLSEKDWRRLRNDPVDFFSKAKHPLSLIGKRIFKTHLRTRADNI